MSEISNSSTPSDRTSPEQTFNLQPVSLPPEQPFTGAEFTKYDILDTQSFRVASGLDFVAREDVGRLELLEDTLPVTAEPTPSVISDDFRLKEELHPKYEGPAPAEAAVHIAYTSMIRIRDESDFVPSDETPPPPILDELAELDVDDGSYIGLRGIVDRLYEERAAQEHLRDEQ